MQASDLQGIQDRLAIVDTMNRYASGVDGRDATLYRSCFEDPLEIDMGGGGAQSWSADAWVEQALKLVSSFAVTQHIITNHVIEVDGDEARCRAYLQAQHWNPDHSWLVGGYYSNRLRRGSDGWRISHLALTITWQQNH